jgi:hypothetical protein
MVLRLLAVPEVPEELVEEMYQEVPVALAILLVQAQVKATMVVAGLVQEAEAEAAQVQ